MPSQTFDLKGLKCPGPTLKLTSLMLELNKGDLIEVVADCPTFEDDVKGWCVRQKRVLLWIREEGNGAKRCQIQL